MAEQARAAAAQAIAAGPALRATGLAERVDVLGQLLEWLGEQARTGQLTARLAGPLGFHPATLERGLTMALADWDRASLARLAERELGGIDPRPPDWTAVVLAGSIPSPTVLSIVASLVVGSPVVAKTGRFDPVTATIVAERLATLDPVLGAALQVVDARGDDRGALAALRMAPCVVASGSDETIAALAETLEPSQHFVGYGHRMSIAVFGPELEHDPGARAAACAGLALDTALWDQLGCCSPVALYVLGGREAAQRLGEDLANEFAKMEAELPRGLVPIEARVRARHEVDEAELRAAAGDAVQVWRGEGSTLVIEPDARWRPAPLHRFLRVHPIDPPNALHAALAPLGGRLSSVALAGLGPHTEAVAQVVARHGASRTCGPGSLQAPPLDWPRDGRPVLGTFLP